MSDEPERLLGLIQVWVKEPAKGGLFEGTHIRHIENRAFIVGKSVVLGHEDDPRIGLTVWLPVDDVLRIIEFPDIETARIYYAKHEEEKRSKADDKSSQFLGLRREQFTLRALFVTMTIAVIVSWAISADPSLVTLAGWALYGMLIGMAGTLVIGVPYHLVRRCIAQRRHRVTSENLISD